MNEEPNHPFSKEIPSHLSPEGVASLTCRHRAALEAATLYLTHGTAMSDELRGCDEGLLDAIRVLKATNDQLNREIRDISSARDFLNKELGEQRKGDGRFIATQVAMIQNQMRITSDVETEKLRGRVTILEGRLKELEMENSQLGGNDSAKKAFEA